MPVNGESAALIAILEGIRVPRDGVIVIHSAIARLSRQGFRAEAMIEAFLNYMRDGTVVMPTMTWRTVTPQNPVWDEIRTRSETGVMTEMFRTRYANMRSIHPTHSVAAYGAAAKILVSQHHLDSTPVSPRSPYGLMRDFPTTIMMIGVGLECCTAIHLPEEMIAPHIYLRPAEEAEAYECIDRHGASHRVWTRRHLRLDRDFPKFGSVLEKKGLIKFGMIGDCSFAIVGQQDLIDVVSAALDAEPRATLRHPETAV